MHIKTHILILFSVHSASTTPSLLCVIYWPVHPSLSLINNIPPLGPTDMMQLTPFILILGILFGITLDHDAYAIPLTREQTGVVTLPLKQTPMRRDLHPHMVCPLCSCSSKVYSYTIDQLLQMHNARAQRRLARMSWLPLILPMIRRMSLLLPLPIRPRPHSHSGLILRHMMRAILQPYRWALLLAISSS
jgi:hypothetical protein